MNYSTVFLQKDIPYVALQHATVYLKYIMMENCAPKMNFDLLHFCPETAGILPRHGSLVLELFDKMLVKKSVNWETCSEEGTGGLALLRGLMRLGKMMRGSLFDKPGTKGLFISKINRLLRIEMDYLYGMEHPELNLAVNIYINFHFMKKLEVFHLRY